MTKQIRIEKQTATDGYQNGVADVKASLPKGYQNDPHYIYLLDKAINQIQNHQNYPADYPNPPAGLAYCFGAYVEPALKIITIMAGNDELEKSTRAWFLQYWLPKAESALMVAPPISLRYGKNRKVPAVFNNLIGEFEISLQPLKNNLP